MTDSIKITISRTLYNKLVLFGIIDDTDVRSDNAGKSDYSKHVIQPWSIIKEYNLNYWDGDITWITPADMSDFGTISDGGRSITIQGYNSCGTTLVPKNSIVISNRAPIGND